MARSGRFRLRGGKKKAAKLKLLLPPELPCAYQFTELLLTEQPDAKKIQDEKGGKNDGE